MSVLKVAAVQAAPAFLDLAAGVAKARSIIKQAADEECDLVVFPEAWLPGYPFHIWLGSPAWAMRFVPRYVANSLEVGGPEFEAVADAARENGIMVSLGYSERAGGSLYLGQALFARDGALIAARRKLKPTHVERAVFGDGDGAGLAVHTTELGRIGMLCCWEHIQPLSKYALYSQGEQIHCAAWPSFSLYRDLAHALGAEVNLAASRVYAVEGQCFVVAACAVTTAEMLATIAATPEHAGLLETGGGHAMIFGPDGRELAGALSPDAEGLVTAHLDLDAIALAKATADPAGHYARPDVTRLWLDRSPRRPVIEAGAPEAAPPRQEADEPAASSSVSASRPDTDGARHRSET